MDDASNHRDLKALRGLINQADLVLASIPNPHPSIASARESLAAAAALAKDFSGVNPAVAMGAKGGTATAKRGPEYFAKIAGMRKNRAGGRPPKKVSQ